MAIPFSSTTTSVRSICQPKSLLSFRDSHNCTKRIPVITNLSLSSSSSNYLKGNAIRLVNKLVVTKKKFLQRRAGIMFATIEEIEAEKSLIEKDARKRMDKAIESIRENFDSIRTGRASLNMLDRIEIEYYGTPVSLKSVAQISSPDSTSLLIQPYDKSTLKVIEKAIVLSDLGVTPNNDGDVIRLTVPQLTADRRKELSKIVAKQAEDGKVAIRNIRRDAIKSYEKLEKDKKLSEDNVKDLTGDLQKVTDEYMKKIEAVLKQKEKELLTV